MTQSSNWFLIATHYGHRESKTFNMNYTHKTINKWALPLSYPSLHSKLHFSTRTLTRQDLGDACGTHRAPHTLVGSGGAGGWCWWPVGAKPSSPAPGIQQDPCPDRTNLLSNPSGPPGIPEPGVEDTKGFKHLQQAVPSHTRNKPVHFCMVFKVNATLIAEYWIQTVEKLFYSY